MTIVAVQYLESDPGSSQEIQREVKSRLRRALDLLPISMVLIGWETSASLIEVCRQETDKAGAKLYRWHPLLTGDGEFYPKPEWQTIGLNGDRVPGYRGMPEFTFVCPNRPDVQEAASAHLEDVLRTSLYDGIFLDRIRFPSPAANPSAWLACFCPDCYAAAGELGLDLGQAQHDLLKLCSSAEQAADLIPLLFQKNGGGSVGAHLTAVDQFMRFRISSITRFVSKASDLIRGQGVDVGLDTFSPSLAYLVGQDLRVLNEYGDWLKPMTYGHTLGPSGLPFELGELTSWLRQDLGMEEADALQLLSNSLRQPLPETLESLRRDGVKSEFLAKEVALGCSSGVDCLLAGMELVEMPGVTYLSPRQIQADLQAYLKGGADGLVLSWDLQHMPWEWLELAAAELENG